MENVFNETIENKILKAKSQVIEEKMQIEQEKNEIEKKLDDFIQERNLLQIKSEAILSEN